MENSCTFAPAFGTRAEKFETDEKTEIACVRHPVETGCGHEDESKGKKRTILTMKSLILAQDER